MACEDPRRGNLEIEETKARMAAVNLNVSFSGRPHFWLYNENTWDLYHHKDPLKIENIPGKKFSLKIKQYITEITLLFFFFFFF